MSGSSHLNSGSPALPLGPLSPKRFLEDFWQKRPTVIRQGLPQFEPPISAEELAGLSLEEGVESRIIQEQGPKEPWEVWQGPLSEALFRRLPESTPWTLLVQAVDQWVPEVAALRDQFNFIPSWRLDDVMISYANKGGSVGPHYDHYDVFLIQAQGIREWHIGQKCSDEDPLLEGPKVRILERFESLEKHELHPGDILYLPPKYAHYGPALTDDCMTISIGFRAPSHVELFQDFTKYLEDELTDFDRYEDPDLDLQTHSAEMSDASFDRVQKIFQRYIEDPARLRDWFGRLMTEPKYPELEPPMEGIVRFETLIGDLQGAQRLKLDEACRLAFHQTPEHLQVFIDGESYQLSTSLSQVVIKLSQQRFILLDEILLGDLEEALQELLVDWINRQKLIIE